VLQADIPDLKAVLDNVEAVIASTKACYLKGEIIWGPRMQAFLAKSKDLGGSTPGSITIGGVKIKVTIEKRDKLYSFVRSTASLLRDSLQERMPDSALLRALLVFDSRCSQ